MRNFTFFMILFGGIYNYNALCHAKTVISQQQGFFCLYDGYQESYMGTDFGHLRIKMYNKPSLDAKILAHISLASNHFHLYYRDDGAYLYNQHFIKIKHGKTVGYVYDLGFDSWCLYGALG